jgi:hypoxanthine-guanine phosphoribosyltransferase
VADFVKEFPVGGFIQLPYRPAKMYGVQVPKKNSTRHKMLVEDLIKELQTLPAKALIILSSDGEGNEYRTAYLVEGGEFDENDEHLEGCGLKVGDSFVVIWPHG